MTLALYGLQLQRHLTVTQHRRCKGLATLPCCCRLREEGVRLLNHSQGEEFSAVKPRTCNFSYTFSFSSLRRRRFYNCRRNYNHTTNVFFFFFFVVTVGRARIPLATLPPCSRVSLSWSPPSSSPLTSSTSPASPRTWPRALPSPESFSRTSPCPPTTSSSSSTAPRFWIGTACRLLLSSAKSPDFCSGRFASLPQRLYGAVLTACALRSAHPP